MFFMKFVSGVQTGRTDMCQMTVTPAFCTCWRVKWQRLYKLFYPHFSDSSTVGVYIWTTLTACVLQSWRGGVYLCVTFNNNVSISWAFIFFRSCPINYIKNCGPPTFHFELLCRCSKGIRFARLWFLLTQWVTLHHILMTSLSQITRNKPGIKHFFTKEDLFSLSLFLANTDFTRNWIQ